MLVGAQPVVVAGAHPGLGGICVEIGHHYPDATDQVNHDEEGEEEGNQAIHAIFDPRELLQVFEHFVFVLHYFENFEQPG